MVSSQYNTRRKSLSLTQLGVIPVRQRQAHRLPKSPKSPVQAVKAVSTIESNTPPTKRVKRSHTLTDITSTTLALSSSSDTNRQAHSQNTPPPSPGTASHRGKVDLAGIEDDVVAAVIDQLQSTGNRPHLIKELATVLASRLRTVETSANPTAIISSRLTTYLRRPWTALAQCPLAKEQVQTHPRRVYYHLTTQPKQPIPEYNENEMLNNMRIISPSVSSGPDEEEIEQSTQNSRDRLSPSPELDLSSHDLGPSHPFIEPDVTSNPYHSRRGASPPLEHDEREFTQTANVMQARKASEQAEARWHQLQHSARASPSNSSPAPSDPQLDSSTESFPSISEDVIMELIDQVEEENEEMTALRNREAAAALFGQSGSNHLSTSEVTSHADLHFSSSPMLRPMTGGRDGDKTAIPTPKLHDSDLDSFGVWGDLKSPEHIGLKELDDLLGAY